MIKVRSRILFSLSMVFLWGPFSRVSAWEDHHALMEVMLHSQAAVSRVYLQKSVRVPSASEERDVIHELAGILQINEGKVPVFSESGFLKKGVNSVKIKDLLASFMIDEPDEGMDQDLPDSADPTHDRAWMGGKTGPTSQGFRHMFFPGFQWNEPLLTLQIPLHAVGQAPAYYEKLRAQAARFFSEGNVFWGLRTLLWSLHIMQDLHQPFHVIQVPSLKMLPWQELFSGFVTRSTQAMANYHYAYEGLILEYIKEANINAFQDCFEIHSAKGVVSIQEVIQNTRMKAKGFGDSVYSLFGNDLKNIKVNLPLNQGEIDYYALIHEKDDLQLSDEEVKTLRSSEVAFIRKQMERVLALKKVRAVTCELMHGLSEATWGEMDRALSPL